MAQKIRIWETREFRWLVLVLVMAGSLLAVLLFEIIPLIEHRGAPPPVDMEEALPAEDAFAKDPSDPRWSGMLAGVEDMTPIEVESPQYLALVRYASKAAPDAFRKEAKRIEYSVVQRAIAQLRGRAVIAKAIVLDSRVIALPTKAGDVEFVYRAYLIDRSASEGYVIDFPKPFPPAEKRTTVQAEALLFKLGTYEVKNGVKVAAHLVGLDIRALPDEPGFPDESGHSWYLIGATVAFALLVVTLVILFQARQKRRPLPPLPPHG